MGEAAKKLDNSGEMSIEEAAAYIAAKLRKPYTVKTLRNKLADAQGPRHISRFGVRIFLQADLDAWIGTNTRVVKAFSK